MKIHRREDSGVWEIECDGTRQELYDMGLLICSMASEGVGQKKEKEYFEFNFNKFNIKCRTNSEFWMFGRGLILSSATPAANLLSKKLSDGKEIVEKIFSTSGKSELEVKFSVEEKKKE